MSPASRQESGVWALARSQHWLVTTRQLRALGFTEDAIAHRVREGRLWRVHRGVYVVGRRELSREGEWMAAVLACGVDAALCDLCAAALWNLSEGPLPRRPSVAAASGNG